MRMTETELLDYEQRQLKNNAQDKNSIARMDYFKKVNGITATNKTKPVQAKLDSISKKGKQTKTEMEYGRMLAYEFPNTSIIPWGLTLRMSNGHKYTPDFAVLLPGKILLVEVKARGKNGFRQASYGRAKLAYDQCKKEFPHFDYRFAEKHCGVWNV